MVGLKISAENIEETVKILGLTDEQGKTYLSLLSLGTATLGQISLLSGLDYLKTQDSLQMLIGSKLAKRIPGKVGRYVALEPFLKSFSLAYDPITLVNIRKESSNIFQAQDGQLNNLFSSSIQEFQNDVKGLEGDFFQSLTPVTENFKILADNLRNVITTSERKIDENIEKILLQTQLLIDESNNLNEQIRQTNVEKLEEIPNIFQKYIHNTENELAKIADNSIKTLNSFKNGSKSELGLIERDIIGRLDSKSNEINENISRFEQNRFVEKNDFQNKIEEIKSSLEQIRVNANLKKSNFQSMRDGYKEVNNHIEGLISEIQSIIERMTPLINDSIIDIENRKLFKGKEAFLNNLRKLEDEKKSVIEVLENQRKMIDKISYLDSTLDEIEVEVVEATESGIQKIEKVLKSEVQLISDDIMNIQKQVARTDRRVLQLILSDTKKEVQTKIRKLDAELDQNINQLGVQFGKTINEIAINLFTLMKGLVTEYKSDLNAHFGAEGGVDIEKGNISRFANKLNELKLKSNSDLKSVYEDVLNVQEEFIKYFSGLNTFTTNFADTQLETFISTLNKTKEYIDSQINKIEYQLEQEISAIIFKIKEMREKLNKILEASRLDHIPDFESSLLSSDLVVGEPVIIMLLRDLTIRAKASLTILMPRPELQTLNAASKLPMRTRVNIIGDFRKVPKSTLKRILSANNVRLKQLDGVDFWGCIRDSEELLVCPEPKDPAKEDLIGVITTNENLVELFSQELMTYTTRSREILPQDIE